MGWSYPYGLQKLMVLVSPAVNLLVMDMIPVVSVQYEIESVSVAEQRG
jgi:hypothetical protein